MLIPENNLRRRILNSALVVFSFSLVLAPWVVRNYQVYKAIIPGVTLSGYNLYRHNYYVEGGEGFHNVYNDEIEAVQEELLRDYKDALTGSENEYEMDRFYGSLALDVISANPGRYLLLSAFRFIPLWTNYGVRYGFISNFTWNISGLVNLVLLALALVAMLRRRFSRPAKILPVVALILFFTLSHMLVNARMRFIIPVVPYVIAFSCDQLFYFFDRRKVKVGMSDLNA